jgi:hypothetical protein
MRYVLVFMVNICIDSRIDPVVWSQLGFVSGYRGYWLRALGCLQSRFRSEVMVT